MQQRTHHALFLSQQPGQQVQRQQFAVVVLLSQFLGALYRFLGLDRVFVETHFSS